MGQGKSKPPTRVVVTDNTVIADNVNAQDEDVVNNNKDALGIEPEESDYPEPKPAGKQPRDPSALGSHRKQTLDGKVPDRSETMTQPSDLQYHLVPVGASFQKHLKKKSQIDLFDMEYYDKARKHQLLSVSTDITPASQSLSNALTPSLSDLSKAGRAVNSVTPKRNTMLSTREQYETHTFSRATTPAKGLKPEKGQVRLFTYTENIHKEKNFQDFEDMLADEIAEKHKHHRAEDYRELVMDLTAGTHTDSLKVKIILSWISKQSIGYIQFNPPNPEPASPNGYMLLMQNDQGTYPVFFALLCRTADIKCSIISGISKGSNYDVGSDDSDDLRNTWNAVLINDTWQLVHPLWVCRGLARRQMSGWMTIEREGKTHRELSTANTGSDIPAFNNYFIFTKPEEFIHRNFPDDAKWQLLQEPISKEEFFRKAYLRPPFFQNGFKLLSEDKCILISENGDPVKITIGYSKENFSEVVFGYELRYKLVEEQSDETEIISVDGSTEQTDRRFVLVSKDETKVTFNIRFIRTGTFKLKFYGGLYTDCGNKPPWIMDVKLVCNAISPQAVPLPFDPGWVGWGPGPVASELGLYVPSHVESIVHLTKDETEIISFVLREPVDVIVELEHANTPRDSLSEFIDCEIEVQYDVSVLRTAITYPGKGEYALRMDVRQHNRLKNACNYVVHTRKERPFETFYKRKARRMVQEAMQDSDIGMLETALQACNQYKLPENDTEVVGARNRLEFLTCKRDLYVALLVHRIDVAEHALYRTRKANLENLLDKEIRRVEAHLKFILHLNESGWIAEVPEIDRLSLVELSQLRSPRRELQLVITAMYMLLGVNENFLKDWKNVRVLLKDQEATLVEMARLEKYVDLGREDELPLINKEVLQRVERLVSSFTESDIRKVDNSAAAYIRWVKTMMKSIAQKHKQYDDLDESQSPISRQPTAFRENNSQRNNYKPSVHLVTTGKRQSSVITTSSNVLRSKSGKVQILQHTMTKGNQIVDRQLNTSLVQETNFEINSQTSLAKVTKLHENKDNGDTLGSLTPVSLDVTHNQQRSSLLTARPTNRILTAKAETLNQRRAHSRLMTASGQRGPILNNINGSKNEINTPGLLSNSHTRNATPVQQSINAQYQSGQYDWNSRPATRMK